MEITVTIFALILFAIVLTYLDEIDCAIHAVLWRIGRLFRENANDR